MAAGPRKKILQGLRAVGTEAELVVNILNVRHDNREALCPTLRDERRQAGNVILCGYDQEVSSVSGLIQR